MYLYQKQGQTINVYNFNAEHSDLVNYRMEQMKKIPQGKRVLYAETNSEPMEPLFQHYIGQLDQITFDYLEADDDIRYGDGDINARWYHKLKAEENKDTRKELLQRYYQGQLTDKDIAKIQYESGIRYYLLKNRVYTPDIYDEQLKVLNGIIEIPESLYLLQLLQQGKFSLIGDKDISEQLSLYNLSYVDNIHIEEMLKMDTCGITDDVSSKVLIKAHNDAKVLSLIKKR